MKLNFNSFQFKNNSKTLTKDQEYKLILNWQKNKDQKSLNQILEAYNKLVVSITKKYLTYGLPHEDLIQEGRMGLISAIEKFDISKGFRLSTYARWWIKALVQDYILKNWSIVKNGSTASQKTLFFGINKIKKEINFSSFNFMGNEELKKVSNLLNMKTIEIQNMEARLSMGDQSLNQRINDDDEGDELISTLKDDYPNQEKIFEKKTDDNLKKEWLNRAISDLSIRERFIIRERKLNYKAKTLDEIGKELKVSKERVRQIEVAALKKLQYKITNISNQSKDFFIN